MIKYEKVSKLNVIFANAEYLNGYTNIASFYPENPSKEEHIIIGDIKDLSWIVDNGELEELICMNVLEYIEYNNIGPVIANWVSKIKVGGKFILGFCDAFETARLFNIGSINIQDYNVLIHGKQNPPYLLKKSSHRADQLVDFIEKQHSYKLMKHTLDGLDVTLTFERVS